MVTSKNFIPQNEMSRSIYRFLSFDSLVEMLVKEQLALVNTSRWDDPFENYFFNCHIYDRGVAMDYKEIATRMYGQCWTLTPESDALWRIYSSDKRGIRIRTTLANLFGVVNATSSDTPAESYDSIWMGKVEYRSEDDIREYMTSKKHMPHIDSEFMIRSMLLKREAFEHEKEVRVIYNSDHAFKGEVKSYDIVPNNFIDEVTFDPRIDRRMQEIYSKALVKLGLTAQINKSKLYSFEPLRIDLI